MFRFSNIIETKWFSVFLRQIFRGVYIAEIQFVISFKKIA